MKFNICVAIQIKSSELKQNQALIQRVLKENPEFIELRFDYIDDTKNLTDNFVDKLQQIVQTNSRTIFTMRDSSEGGQMELGNHERMEIIATLIKAQPEYVDIEMNSNAALLKQIVNLAVENNVNLIFSSHDFEKTPTYEKAYEIIDSFINRLSHNLKLDFKIIESSIYKLIFTAQKFEDNLIPLNLCKTFSQKNIKIISFCMEEMGIFSRTSCVNVGSFLTYASLEDKTAPGQINIKKMREIHELIFFTDS